MPLSSIFSPSLWLIKGQSYKFALRTRKLLKIVSTQLSMNVRLPYPLTSSTLCSGSQLAQDKLWSITWISRSARSIKRPRGGSFSYSMKLPLQVILNLWHRRQTKRRSRRKQNDWLSFTKNTATKSWQGSSHHSFRKTIATILQLTRIWWPSQRICLPRTGRALRNKRLIKLIESRRMRGHALWLSFKRTKLRLITAKIV